MTKETPIPHKSHLSDVYQDAKPQIDRYNKMLTTFAELYKSDSVSPDFIVRSPGRVNIIGDHVDYSLFPCLPMAVENDMIIMASVTQDGRHEISNLDSSFPKESYTLDVHNPDSIVPIDATISDWVNYFKCGVVVADDFLKTQSGHVRGSGLRVLVDGNVPSGGGLSSSAAFVVCSTLINLLANEFTPSQQLLNKLSITCEQHLGVNSGGLDQSASIFGEKDSALHVSFYPELKSEKFAFPSLTPKIAFLISNSLVVARKHETGPVNYNLRVVEVTLAANVLATKLNLKLPPNGNLQAGTLRDVLDCYFADSPLSFGQDIPDSRQKLVKMVQLVDEYLTQHDGYTTEQVAEILKSSVTEIQQKYMTTYPVRYKALQLYKRAKHVYEETIRVLDFLTVMNNSDTSNDATSSKEIFVKLGNLMNQSQDSARDLYNNSCPEIDELCSIGLENGSYGSRVTGAGWGGCAVHLVPQTDLLKLRQVLVEKYYKIHFPNITEKELEEALLMSQPGNGTTIIDNISFD